MIITGGNDTGPPLVSSSPSKFGRVFKLEQSVEGIEPVVPGSPLRLDPCRRKV
jgi:hypothetical protein